MGSFLFRECHVLTLVQHCGFEAQKIADLRSVLATFCGQEMAGASGGLSHSSHLSGWHPSQQQQQQQPLLELMFHPGLPNFKPRQWCDSSCSVLPIGEVSYQNLPYPTTSTPYPSQSTLPHQPPSHIPPFMAQPPATLAQLWASKHKFRKHRFLCIHLHYPSTTSNPRCAQFRIWQSGARKQRRQLKYIHYMTQHIAHAVKESEHSLGLFTQAALHHSMLLETTSGEVICRPLKHQHSLSPPPPTATLHVAPLRWYSIHNQHLIAHALKTQLKYHHRFDQPPWSLSSFIAYPRKSLMHPIK